MRVVHRRQARGEPVDLRRAPEVLGRAGLIRGKKIRQWVFYQRDEEPSPGRRNCLAATGEPASIRRAPPGPAHGRALPALLMVLGGVTSLEGGPRSLGSRRAAHVLWAVLAAAGVILASGLGASGHWEWAGIASALVAGGCWACYRRSAAKRPPPTRSPGRRPTGRRHERDQNVSADRYPVGSVALWA